ncbi:MAG TPA: DUF177 domain-containing protein [Ignavibacteriaceae bacterium]|jgi:uncharacterized protein|nr:DUF177 domain-containing protein [Ignavibacteriaceae bacterium]
MIIKITNLSEGTHEFTFEENIDHLDLEKPFFGKYKSFVVLNKLHDQIILSVSSKFKVKYQCDRCGKEFNSKLNSEYKMVYLMNEKPAETDSIFVTYLSRTEDKIEIKNDVREFALLAVPMKNLCKEDCKGLCYKCGADLNTEQCKCTNDEIDPRWKPLMNLKDKLNLN